jgi:hypothetical protein
VRKPKVVVEEEKPIEKDREKPKGTEGKGPSDEDMVVILQTMAKTLDDVLPSIKSYMTSLTDEQREQIKKQVQIQVMDSLFPPKSGTKEKENLSSEKEYFKSLQEWATRGGSSFSAPPPPPPYRGYCGPTLGYGFGGPEGPRSEMGGYGYGSFPGGGYPAPSQFAEATAKVMEKHFEYQRGEYRGRFLTYLNRIPEKIQAFINERTNNAVADLIKNFTELFTESKEMSPSDLGMCIGEIKAFMRANEPGHPDFTTNLGFSGEDFKKALNTLHLVVNEFESMLPFIWTEKPLNKQPENPAVPQSSPHSSPLPTAPGYGGIW